MEKFIEQFKNYCENPSIKTGKAESYAKSITYLFEFLEIKEINNNSINSVFNIYDSLKDTNSEIYKNFHLFLLKRNQVSYLTGGFVSAALSNLKEFISLNYNKTHDNNSLSSILSFLDKYSGLEYAKNDETIKIKGQYAYANAKLAGCLIEEKNPDFKFILSSKWQHSGKISKYFWIQLKDKRFLNSPFTICISQNSKNGKHCFKVLIEICEDELQNYSSEQQSKLRLQFNQSLLKVKQFNPNVYYQVYLLGKKCIIEKNELDLIKYFQGNNLERITTNIDIDIDNSESNESIINKIDKAFKYLIPYYQLIFEQDKSAISKIKECINLNLLDDMEQLPENEVEVISNMSEVEFETFINNEDENSGYVYKEKLSKTRKINQKIIDYLKQLYKGQCQLCGNFAGKEYDIELVEAHHIEYFSKTQNNNSTNIIIICPNCHSIIHKCNPKFNKENKSFIFPKKEVFIKIPGHLNRQ